MRSDQKISVRIGVVVFGALLALFAATPGSAQKRGSDGVIRLEETVIEGRVAKPNAFFINTRQAMVYDTMTIKESFLKEIPASVKKGPF